MDLNHMYAFTLLFVKRWSAHNKANDCAKFEGTITHPLTHNYQIGPQAHSITQWSKKELVSPFKVLVPNTLSKKKNKTGCRIENLKWWPCQLYMGTWRDSILKYRFFDIKHKLTVNFLTKMVALDNQLLPQQLHILRPWCHHLNLLGRHLVRVILLIQTQIYQEDVSSFGTHGNYAKEAAEMFVEGKVGCVDSAAWCNRFHCCDLQENNKYQVKIDQMLTYFRLNNLLLCISYKHLFLSLHL